MYSGARTDISEEQTTQMGILGATMFAELDACARLDVGAHVVCDRAFTNLAVAMLMRLRKTTLTGTLNRNRKGVNTEDFNISGERGSMDFGSTALRSEAEAQTVKIGVTVWMDRKPVWLLSTEIPCGSTEGQFAIRRNPRSLAANIHSDPFWEPTVRHIYNKLMGGVDGNDQLRSFNHMRLRRMRRWPLHVFIGTLDVAVVNAMICFWDWQTDWGIPKSNLVTGKDFSLNIVKQIVATYSDSTPFPLGDLLAKVDSHRRKRGSSNNHEQSPPPAHTTTTVINTVSMRNFSLHNVLKTTERVSNGKKCAETIKRGSCVECVHKLPPRSDKAYKQISREISTTYYCTNPVCATPGPRKHVLKKNYKPYLHPQCIEAHTLRMNKVVNDHDDNEPPAVA